MRKFGLSLFTILFACGAYAENPFTRGYENQIAINIGQGVNGGFLIAPPSQPVPFYMLHFQYSQPTTFFKLDARQSLNVVQTLGLGEKYGWHWNKYTIPIALLSEDIALLSWKNWYVGPGLAIGMQAKQNERLGAKLIFGFRLFVGYAINDCTTLEAFMQHYSNGNTAPENNSYAFYGVGVTHSF